MADPRSMAAESSVTSPRPGARSVRHRRYLKNYLLNRRLQLHYVFAVVGVSASVCTALGILIWRQATHASQVIREVLASPGMDWVPEENKRRVMDRLAETDSHTLLVMAGVGIGLSVVLALFLIVFTHKIAGPLYKIGLYLDAIRDGKLRLASELRRGDHLQDFFHRFKEMNDELCARAGREAALYAASLAAVTSASAPPEVLGDLAALRAEREAELGLSNAVDERR